MIERHDNAYCFQVMEHSKSTPGKHLVRSDMTRLLSHCKQMSRHQDSRVLIARRKTNIISYPSLLWSALVTLCFFATSSSAAWIEFHNCLPDNTINSSPPVLQFVPLWFNAKFNESDPTHNLNVTIYGNVTGQTNNASYPGPHSPDWTNPQKTLGKIIDVYHNSDGSLVYTTLSQKFDVLTFTSNLSDNQFCRYTLDKACPVAPAFFVDPYDYTQLPGFTVAHDFYASYAFATIVSTVQIIAGDPAATKLGCVSASITPSLGSTVPSVLRYLPLVVLVLVGFSTIFAAIFSPWGSSNIFRWSSNYGRDEDLLRLVTPGFGDCLQYIQFIILAGSLSLSYPGFFQPVVSQVGWSTLMFNESFVDKGGYSSLEDGIYVVNGTYGLTRMRQLVGMGADNDIWAGMIIWLLVIIVAVVILSQLYFVLRFLSRKFANNPEEDLQSKNWPFTGGNVIRIVCNYFLLPIFALTFYQLIIARQGPAAVVIVAALLVVALIVFAIWCLRLIISTKPRAKLFDDLPTVLLYGPLYNTYSDDSAPFAFIPVLLTFARGIAIGAVQPSGIAQLVLLAICEVVLILTLHAFRPFYSPTSMNAYHTFIACTRLAIILLMVAFVPSLSIGEGSKGWIGNAILLLHGIVLVFGFFLHALQTIIEVGARLAGAGGENRGAATRGGLTKVFGVRQLSKRQKRPSYGRSLNSEVPMLTDDGEGDVKSFHTGARSRSISASSAIMLNQHASSGSHRLSGFMDAGSSADIDLGPSRTESGQFTLLPSGAAVATQAPRPRLALRTVEPPDPYYRAPRPRRPTGEMVTPGAKSRESGVSETWQAQTFQESPERLTKRLSTSQQALPPPQISAPYLRTRGDSDPNISDPRRPNVDYAVREVDFYYGVRGPALSSGQAGRRLKTGPADPVGPVSSATGWFKGIFGKKSKDKAKGFEVVRSARAPPAEFLDDSEPGAELEPYRDSPQPQLEAYLPGQRTRDVDGEGQDLTGAGAQERIGQVGADDEMFGSGDPQRVSDLAPSIGPLDVGGSIELPSRFNSKYSQRSSRHASNAGPVPSIPSRSTHRWASSESAFPYTNTQSPVPVNSEDTNEQRVGNGGSAVQPRLPFNAGRNSIDPNRLSAAESIRVVEGDSGGEAHTAELSPLSGLSDRDRPTSVGYVVQHRASDNIHHSGVDASRTGSAAEMVGGEARPGSAD